MKKKFFLSIIGVIAFILLINIILIGTGWYNEMVSGQGEIGGFTTAWDPSYSGGEQDHTDHGVITIGCHFRTISGTKIQYHINAEIVSGTADVVVYDITDTDLDNHKTDQLTVAYSKTIQESGIIDIDLSELPIDRTYIITVFENAGSDFYVELRGDYQLKRWMYLHDKYLARLPFIHILYDPAEL